MKKKLHSEIWWAVKIGPNSRAYFMIEGAENWENRSLVLRKFKTDITSEVTAAHHTPVLVRITELPKKPTNRRGAKKAGKRPSTPKEI